MMPATSFYVIFAQGRTHWITRWLKPNYSHIILITHDDYNWIVLNPARAMLEVIIPPLTLDKSPLEYFSGPRDSVLYIRLDERSELKQYGSIGMLNCVTWSKYILEIGRAHV